jgi:hypothetical protein
MNSTNKPLLKIDWATHEAAKFACVNWHYSGCLPSSLQKRVAVGAWEDGKFIGAVVFGHGANPNIGKPYDLTINQCVELTRIALISSHETPVTRIVRLALGMLQKSQPNIRLIVSYADQGQGHHGGIYQGGNWVYVGSMKGVPSLKYRGKVWHAKALRTSHPNLKHSTLENVAAGDKHKYLMPLDAAMRAQIAPLAKPYPKRTTRTKEQDAGHPPALGGVTPTRALHLKEPFNSTKTAG